MDTARHSPGFLGWLGRFLAAFALFGFLACVGMVLFAKLLGVFLKRRDDYYEDGDGDV